MATAYQVVCATGSSGTPTWSGWGNWVGNHLVAGADLNNPVASCEVQPTSTITRSYDGGATSASLQTTDNAYDAYGRLTQSTDQASGGSPWQIVHKTWYVWDDAVSPGVSGSSGEYVIDRVAFSDTEDVSGNRYACSSTAYSGATLMFGNSATIGHALPTTQTTYTSGCGTGTASNPIATTAPTGALSTTLSEDSYGNTTATKDAEGTAGNAAHLGCVTPSASGTWSACTSFDATFQTLPLTSSNALNQQASTGYGATPASQGGFGLWPTASTDANGQTTNVAYDGLGRVTSLRLPGEAAAYTKQWGYTVAGTCATSDVTTPCLELDETQRLDSSTTVLTRSFYDGLGHLVETRKPGPSASGNDIVQFNQYDTSGRVSWASIPYFVPAYTGTGSPFATPDTSQPHTTTSYDGLGRATRTTDALGHVTTTSYSVQSGTFGAHGGNTDEVITTIDALGHKADVWTDPFGRVNIVRRYTGTSPYTLYAQTQQWYTYQGALGSIVHPDGTTLTTFSYDLAGRKTSMTDPDSGNWSYSYDLDGNLTQQSDGRGAAGTLYAGYDGLDRQLWRNSTNTPTGAYVTYRYDDTTAGNAGIGRLTGESFNGGAGGTALGAGSYAYSYDARGQRSGQTITLGGTAYSFAYASNDAGQPTTTAYSDGEVEALSYDATDFLAGATTTPSGGTATTLANALTYTGSGGAFGQPTGASVGGGVYTLAASFDALNRLTASSLSRVSPAATLFSSARTYDAAGNIATVSTTLPAGTDTQAFCYDEQNRLTWASAATGTPPCGGTLTAGTLSSASYTQSFAYDTFGRLTSGPLGSYAYGPGMQVPAPAIPSPLHAALSAGIGYTATYDAAGNMLCRAPTASAGTCTTSTQTGQPLSYDNEGRLAHWQNLPSVPTSTADFAYDGEGQRVAQQVGGTGGTTTYYVGGLEEVTGGTLTKYLSVPGVVMSERVGTSGLLSYLATDGLSSVSAALDGAGTLTAAQLFTPYGSMRYSSGTMPTAKGYTGQYADASSGLEYYIARYYDPVLGQFSSADTMLPGDGFDVWGLSRYAYVEGNPEGRTDPTGHCPWCVIGAIGGAIVGGGIAYGVQVYNNFQSGKSGADAFTQNIDWGAVGAGAVTGAFIGGTMGAGATAAGAFLAGGGSIAGAAYVGGDAALTFAAYGIAPTVGGDVLALDTADLDAQAIAEDDPDLIQARADEAERLRGSKGGGAVVYDSDGNRLWGGRSGGQPDPDRPYVIDGHPFNEVCGETKGACAAGSQIADGSLPPGRGINIYYSQRANRPPCIGCQRAASMLAADNGYPVIVYSRDNLWWGFDGTGLIGHGKW